jgi:hypothetical protein
MIAPEDAPMAKHPDLCLECTLRKYRVQSRYFGWLFLGRRESILSNSHIFSVTSMLVPKTKGGCLASVPGFGVPGRCLEVRCVDVLIVAGVYVIGGLTGGYYFFVVVVGCENISTWISICVTTVFSQQGGISIYKFPKRFSDISWAAEISLH